MLVSRYWRLAHMSSKQLAEHGDIHCWYAETQQWFESHGISINALPQFQYSMDCVNMTRVEKNRVIWTDIINLGNKIIWNSPTTHLCFTPIVLATTLDNSLGDCVNTFNKTSMVISKIYMSMAWKVVKHSLIGVTWNDTPESTIHVCDKASFKNCSF